MLFPMLLGRSAVRGHAMVDPRVSFSLGRPSRRAERMLAARVAEGDVVIAQTLKSGRGD